MECLDSHEGIRRKLVVIGDEGCGKTSLLTVFTLGYFPTLYYKTFFDNYIFDCSVDGVSVQLALWDTGTQEDPEPIRHCAYSEAHVILICFTVDAAESLDNVKNKWIKEVNRFCSGVPIVLAGLKRDLRDGSVAVEKEDGNVPLHFLTPDDGEAAAKVIGADKYMECSSLNSDGVGTVFDAAVRASLPKHKESQLGSCCSLQ